MNQCCVCIHHTALHNIYTSMLSPIDSPTVALSALYTRVHRILLCYKVCIALLKKKEHLLRQNDEEKYSKLGNMLFGLVISTKDISCSSGLTTVMRLRLCPFYWKKQSMLPNCHKIICSIQLSSKYKSSQKNTHTHTACYSQTYPQTCRSIDGDDYSAVHSLALFVPESGYLVRLEL